MTHRIDEESDQLQSLFLKPLCQKMQEQVILDKMRQRSTPKQQKNRQICNHYNFILPQKEKDSCKIHNFRNRNMLNRHSFDYKMTPYQSRKVQEKLFAQQVQLNMNELEVPSVLKGTQDSWLIIKQLQGSLKQADRQSRFNRTQQSSISNLSQSLLPHHRKKYSESQIKKVIKTKTQASLEQHKEENKNIRSMMSYYKNKRAIKQMGKINGSVNLTNNQIQQSVNLKVSASHNKNTDKVEDLIQKIKQSYRKNRKIRMKEKNKIDIFNFSTDKIKIPLQPHFNPFYSNSRQLNGILNSFKMDMSEKQRRPKTQTRMNKSDQLSPSKKIMTNKRFNDVTGWQNLSDKNEGETVCLI